MREIEVKARVTNKQTLLQRIADAGIQLSTPVKQHDVVYGQAGVADNAPGSVWLRIRTEDDAKVIFTLKKQHSGGLDSIEHETEVTDADELVSIVTTLGFSLYSELTKTRQRAHFDDIEICVDDVLGLGTFIEAEKLTDETADGPAVVNELWAILAKLGVDRQDEVFEGYDILINNSRKQNKPSDKRG